MHKYHENLLSSIPFGDHFCEICVKVNELSVHHIRERSKGGNDDLANLMVLCSNCHKEIHRNHPKGYEIKDIYKLLVKVRTVTRQIQSLQYSKERAIKEVSKLKIETFK